MRINIADWKATPQQKRLVREVLESGRLTYGEKTRELEERFAPIHGRKHALFTSSGTSALKIALHAFKDSFGWHDGDEVIIPAVTFVATMNVVLMNNLTPVLVDVDPSTANMDPAQIEKVITERTVAIIPVHLLGQSARMVELMRIARKHGLKVIEDSCETMFVSYQGRQVGSRGDAACFSTYIAHLMVTGVGGFITTNDRKMATLMRSIMFHGRHEAYLNMDDVATPEQRFTFPRLGYSDRATELEAALGLGELEKYQGTIAKRQGNAAFLMDALDDLPLRFPVEDVSEHAFMFFPILTPDRDDLMRHLEEHGIETRTMMPLTTQPVVEDYFGDLQGMFPATEEINRSGLLVGCHQYLSQVELDYLVDTIRDFYG